MLAAKTFSSFFSLEVWKSNVEYTLIYRCIKATHVMTDNSTHNVAHIQIRRRCTLMCNKDSGIFLHTIPNFVLPFSITPFQKMLIPISYLTFCYKYQQTNHQNTFNCLFKKSWSLLEEQIKKDLHKEMNIFAQECTQCVYVGNPKECHANKPSVLSMLAIHNGSSCIVTATVSPKNYSLHGMFAYNTIYSTIHPPQWGEIIYEVKFLFSYTYQGLLREVRSAGLPFCLDFAKQKVAAAVAACR